MSRNYLLDVNVAIALVEPDHQFFSIAQKWFSTLNRGTWGLCPLTEAAFLRITTGVAFQRSMEYAIEVLQTMKGHPSHMYWEIKDTWVDVTSRFVHRIHGHQQVTDAYLLGLAINAKGILVTFNQRIQYLAGSEFSQNLLILE